MITFLSVVYVVVCLVLILVVLLQSGKGGGLGSAFGGGAAGQQIFGGAGAGNLLTRLTAFFAFLFMVLSAVLAYLSSSGEQALDRAARRQGAAQTAEEATTQTGLSEDEESEADLAPASTSDPIDADTSTGPEAPEPSDSPAVEETPSPNEAIDLVEDLQRPEGPPVPGPNR